MFKSGKMSFKLKYLAIALGFVVVSCGGDDEGSPSEGGGGQSISAEYMATLHTEFSEELFPTDYPSNASFGPIIAIIHAPNVNVFNLNQVATAGMESYVETGDIDALATFIREQLGEQNEGDFVIQTGGSATAVGTKTFNLIFTPERTNLTFIANLNPSPDWFVGVSSFSLEDGDTLIEDVNIGLTPLDGGSSLGDSYNSEDGDENAVISVISGAPFGDGPFIQSIASLSLERIN